MFQAAKESANEIVRCLDEDSSDEILESTEIKIQPASSTKQTLTRAFEDLTHSFEDLTHSLKATEFSSTLELCGDSASDVEEKVKFLYEEELKDTTSLNVKLDKMIAVQKLSLNSNRSASQSQLNSTFKESHRATPIKINKADAIKFSLFSRDFATFRGDFEAIIVHNRSAADVGFT